MTGTLETDGLELDAIRRYMSGVLGEPDLPVPTARLISGGKSNLTYFVEAGTHRWVLRRPPLGDIMPGTHDVLREFRVMSALSGSKVPVPRTVAGCSDPAVTGVDFYVMDEVRGRVIRTREDAAGLTAPQCRRLGESLVDTMVDLHETDPASVGLASLGRPSGYLDRQLARWERQFAAVQVRELPLVTEIVAALAKDVPQTQRPGIVHGDYRLDNVMVAADDPTRLVAVLDWEMATLGDPLVDLAALVMFWDEEGDRFNPITNGLMAVEGFPSRAEVLDRYLAARDMDAADLDWYMVFAEFKLAIILEQIHARHEKGQTRGEGFEGVGDMVVQLLDAAMERIHCSTRLSAP